jgi:hypothetical protein
LYRGFAHCHSTFSYDGQYDYPELREIFIKKGLHFVCITEHIEYLDQLKINAIIDGCQSNSDEKFLFIPGIEMDEFVIYFIGIKKVEVDFSSSKTIFDSLLTVAKMCVFSHPIKAKYHYPDWLIDCCDGVEIWNTKHDGIHYPRYQSTRLLRNVRSRHSQAVQLVGMDFHTKSHLSPANIRLLKSGPLTEEFVVNEIKLGCFNIHKNHKNLDEISTVEKYYLWSRIAMMDQAHIIHLLLTKYEITVPKPVKRMFRKLMEGK